MVVKLGLSR